MPAPLRSLFVLLVSAPLLLLGAAASDDMAGSASDCSDSVGPPADHHLHVWSADARDALIRMQEETGERVMDPEDIRVLTADDVIAGLDSAGVERGVLLSTAYFFGNPELGAEDEYARVRAENDYVARQVAEHPERLTGFLSVNPLADYALEEMDRLSSREEFVGLKLHLANSGVELREPADVSRLREVFRRADALGMAVVIHLWTRREDFGARDVNVFVDDVLPVAPDIPVQVAHLGGKGGFDAVARRASDAFASALEDHPERTRNLLFDMGAVPVPTYLAKGDSALLEQVRMMNEGFASAARRLGPDRIVYGTDWPAVSMPGYLDGIRKALSLSDSEFRDVVDDPAPYLR